MRYIFPFADIPIHSKVVIYGASQAGYDFYRQLKSTDYCEIVSWVDRQYEWWREMNLPVSDPETVSDKEFDIVVLTAETERVADSMTHDLIRYGVPKEKIFWKKNYLIGEDIAKKYDYESVRADAKEAIVEMPHRYLSLESLDIVIRVLYAKDLLAKRDCDKHREMYKKLMMSQNDGKEPTEDFVMAYFTEYELKRGWDAFDKSFIELVFSMKSKGFDRNHFIPIDCNGGLINGRHRIAAAIANGIPVRTRKYNFAGFNFHFDRKWLFEHGFSEDEICEAEEECSKLLNDGKARN